MSTITVVRKNGVAAIAADTLTKWGPAKEGAAYIVNNEKILQVGGSYLGIAGPSAAKHVLAHYFGSLKQPPALDRVDRIFSVWRDLHHALKEDYFLRPEEDDEDDYESSRMDVLIASSRGIFGAWAHRDVQEFTRFYSCGFGSPYAMGAMFTVYDRPELDAEQIARVGVEAAAEFDDSTGAPVVARTVSLAD